MSAHETNFSALTSPENQENAPSTKYELRDVHGEGVCTVEVSYDDYNISRYAERYKKMGARKVTSMYVVKGDKKIDVLSLINLPPNTTILMTPNQPNYSYANMGRIACIPEPSSTIGIAVALHELGHAEQSQHSFFDEILSAKNSIVSIEDTFVVRPFARDIRESFQVIKTQFPELASEFPSDEVFDELEKLTDEYEHPKIVLNELKSLKKRLSEGNYSSFEKYKVGAWGNPTEEKFNTIRSNMERRVVELEHEYSHFKPIDEKALEQRYAKIALPLNKLLQTITAYAERDATKRAFQIMRIIYQEVGADISSAQVEPKAEFATFFQQKGACSKSTARLLQNIQKFGGFSGKGALLSALGTYDALEKIAVPSLRRLNDALEK